MASLVLLEKIPLHSLSLYLLTKSFFVNSPWNIHISAAPFPFHFIIAINDIFISVLLTSKHSWYPGFFFPQADDQLWYSNCYFFPRETITGYFLNPLYSFIWFFQWNYTDFFPSLAYSGIAWRDVGWFLGIFRTTGHEIILRRDFSEGFSWNFLLFPAIINSSYHFLI